MCNQNWWKRKRHHAESDNIRMDETIKTPKKVATGTGQMRHCCDRLAECIHCKSWEVGRSIWRHGRQHNPSHSRSYRMWRMLTSVMCFQEWNVVEIEKPQHEGVTKATKVHAIPHFLGEDICRIYFTSTMLDGDCFILYPFAEWVLAQMNVLCCFGGHVVGPPNASIVFIVDDSRFVEIQNSKSQFSKTLTDIT